MRALQIQLRSDGDDAGRVDVVMGHVVVPLDMVEIHGLRDTLHLVEVPKVAIEMGVDVYKRQFVDCSVWCESVRPVSVL